MERLTPSTTYVEFRSEKIPGLIARVHNSGTAEIMIDADQLCTMDTKSNEVDIGDNHIFIRVHPNDDLENKTLSAMKKLEQYFATPQGLEKRFKDSNFMATLGHQFSSKHAVAYVLDHSAVIVALPDISGDMLKQIYNRSELPKITHHSFETAAKQFNVHAWITSSLLSKQPTLRIALDSDPHALDPKMNIHHESTVMLAPSEIEMLKGFISDYKNEQMIKKDVNEAWNQRSQIIQGERVSKAKHKKPKKER